MSQIRHDNLEFGWEGESRSDNFPIAFQHGNTEDSWFGEVRPGQKKGKFSISLFFQNWSVEDYVFMPAAVYAGNRFPAASHASYPYPPVFLPIDTAPGHLLVSDIARLNHGEGESVLRRVASDAGTPGMGIWFRQQALGFFIQTPQKFGGEEIEFVLEESADRQSAQLRILVESSGDGSVFKFHYEEIVAKDLAEYFAAFWRSRKKLLCSEGRHDEIPFSSCWKILEEKVNMWNWSESSAYYTNTNNGRWSSGWTGGLINTLPLIQEGSQLSVERVLKTFDAVFPDGVGQSGFLFSNTDGENWYTDRGDAENGNPHLIRKSGDVLYFGLRQTSLMQERGIEVQPVWLDCLRRLANAFCNLWDRYGQFGQRVDIETGRLLMPNSTSGAIAPAGLILAYRTFREKRFLDTAMAALQRYVDVDLEMGVTSGGPGDAYQCPDSESAFALVESLALAAEETQNEWTISAGLYAAAMAASWTLSYDCEFPADSTFGKLGIRTTGTVFANAQNRHDAPGICTLSGEGLLRLYRLTGEPLLMDLLTDIAHGMPQYLSREDRPIRRTIRVPEGAGEFQPSGWVSERVNVTPNWQEPVGETILHTGWAEISLMLTWNDLPGIYVDLSRERIWVLDNVQAVIRGCELTVHNPTAFDAKVKILVENGSNQKMPLPVNFGASLKRIFIPSGKSIHYLL